jgi:farnesyl-diphosphate farnesyltransferase
MQLEHSSSTSPGSAQAERKPPDLRTLLQETSRTFALTIPVLPEPLQTEVATAYLLFRIIDTFEDATGWEVPQRVNALAFFVRLMDGDEPLDSAETHDVVERWLDQPPLDHAGYLRLLRATPDVIGWLRGLRPAAGAQLRLHVARSARQMAKIVERAGPDRRLELHTLQDLRDYCYAVAGIVGEMLTDLFILQSPSLQAVAGELRARAVEFGEALQLVNILKDKLVDSAEGRTYLPAGTSQAEVFQLARADLRRAVEYTDLLRSAGAERGMVAFNALNARLAIDTLHVLRDKGAGAKLTRLHVTGVAAQVARAVDTGQPLFPDSP